MNARARRRLRGLLPAAAVLLGACSTPIAGELDEREANRIVAALGAHGLPAEKEVDPASDGRFRVQVPRSETGRAASLLADLGLPKKPLTGVVEAMGKGSLVPSRATEHARLLAGVAADLERTLGEIDGIVSARVHLASSRPDPLSAEEPTLPQASVLIRHGKDPPPLSDADVQRLVAGAVPGLRLERVAVVQSRTPTTPFAPDLVRVGPFTATRSTAGPLRATITLAASLNVALVAFAALLWRRLRSRRGPR